MMQKVSELTSPPVVGKFYLVPCARLRSRWEPIVGPWHDDVSLGMKDHHYHLDVRFMPDAVLEYGRRWPREVATMGAIVTVATSAFPYPTRGIAGPHDWEWKRRKCRREMPTMPKILLNGNEASYVGRKILCGKCPHRGFPIDSLPQDENGHVICNGHGLKIDMRKGEVIER